MSDLILRLELALGIGAVYALVGVVAPRLGELRRLGLTLAVSVGLAELVRLCLVAG